jgi:hypothetical protein
VRFRCDRPAAGNTGSAHRIPRCVDFLPPLDGRGRADAEPRGVYAYGNASGAVGHALQASLSAALWPLRSTFFLLAGSTAGPGNIKNARPQTCGRARVTFRGALRLKGGALSSRVHNMLKLRLSEVTGTTAL